MPGKPGRPRLPSRHRLTEFYRRYFLPSIIPLGFGEADQRIHESAIQRIEYFAGRPLDVGEVTPELLEKFSEHLVARSVDDAERLEAIRALQRIRRGYTPSFHHKRIVRIHSKILNGMLRAYFEDVYRPTMRRYSFSEDEVRLHATAVERLLDFAEHELAPSDLNSKLLNSFKRHLSSRRVSAREIQALIHALERIGRSYDPNPKANLKLSLMEADPEKGTLRHFFTTTFLPQRLFSCSEAHRENYRVVLRQLRDHYNRDIRLNELTDAIAADFFSWLLSRGLSPMRVNRTYRSCLFALWRMAYDERMLNHLPRVKRLKETVHVPDAWTLEEMNQLLAHCNSASSTKVSGIPSHVFWEALLRVAWWTGLRKATLLDLRREDLDLSTGWLTVPPTIMKNRRGAKFRLGTDAIAALTELLYYQPTAIKLLPWDKGDRWLHQNFVRIIEASGLPKCKYNKGSFHKIRRSTATKVAELAGVPAASALLGHSNTVITERYLDPSKLPGNDLTSYLPSLSTELELREPPDLAAG